MRISDWSSDVCSSDLDAELFVQATVGNQTVVLPETGRHGRQPGILERDQGRRLDPQQLAGVGRDLGSRCRLVVADGVAAPRIGPRNGTLQPAGALVTMAAADQMAGADDKPGPAPAE